MKPIVIEPGVNQATRAVSFRWRCDKCKPARVGEWNDSLHAVELEADRHEAALHPEPITA